MDGHKSAGAALPKLWGSPLSTEDRVKLARYVYDRGVRYFDKALALISYGGFDQCMLSYGYLPRGYNQVFSAKAYESDAIKRMRID